MPKTKKGKKIYRKMQQTYGVAEGKRVFFASANAGTIKGVDRRTRKRKRG